MNTKQYKICRLVITIVLIASIGISINIENYYLPIIFLLSSFVGMYYCRKQLKSEKVMADERDYKVAGKAARYTIFIYGLIGTIGTFILMAISQKEGIFYTLSQYLAFSVCFIIILNSLLFKYLNKK